MRIQVNLSEEMVQRVDAYAKMMGVSRSAFCSMMVGQSVMNLDKVYDNLESIMYNLPINDIDKKEDKLDVQK